MHDPYAFPPLLTEFDLHLLCEGRHWQSYEKLGAHPRTIDGVTGVNFAVWAPTPAGSASSVTSISGTVAAIAMRKHIPSGIWELFVPGIAVGEKYKFRVNQHGHTVDKCDPYGFAAEVPPRTASIVTDLDQFQWTDQKWMDQRRRQQSAGAADQHLRSPPGQLAPPTVPARPIG